MLIKQQGEKDSVNKMLTEFALPNTFSMFY